MIMKIKFHDGTWFVGEINWKTRIDETKGTHHFKVIEGSQEFILLKGKEIAVPITSAKYFVLNLDKVNE